MCAALRRAAPRRAANASPPAVLRCELAELSRNAGKLMGMPDDTFGMVLAAIDRPHAAACMLATCKHVGAALRVLDGAMGPGAPMVVQVQAVSAALRLPGVGEFHHPALELASACDWVQLFPLLVSPAGAGDRSSTSSRPLVTSRCCSGRAHRPPPPSGR